MSTSAVIVVMAYPCPCGNSCCFSMKRKNKPETKTHTRLHATPVRPARLVRDRLAPEPREEEEEKTEIETDIHLFPL